MTLQSGDIVDRYQLQEFLGSGSFGEVWRASQLADNKDIGVTCAVKIMKLAAERASQRTVASGWLDEVRNLVRIESDAIPRIYGANVWHEHAYIAMELLEGTTLAARLADGPIAWRRALYIADQIARALEAAHHIGIVHRDLKPQNIMLIGPRRLCVIDWGIARLRTSAAQTATSGVIRRPTNDVGTTDNTPVAVVDMPYRHRRPTGTPGYMAPELYYGTPSAFEQDIYALGVVLYQMIAGCLPHAVSTAGDTRTLDKATVNHALVPLRDRCPEAPRAVAELVDSLLARDPERRPRNLRSAIEHASRFPHGVPDPPYVGLISMGLVHAGLYFGQLDAIQHVLDRLTTQPAVLLWGPSGSGKSSLALAGVAATMDRTLFLDTDGWNIQVVRPRDWRVLRVASAATSQRARVGQVVVIDQLEEVVDLEPRERVTFCDAVLALIERSAPVRVRDAVVGIGDTVRVIATIRDDLEWRVDRELPALRPLLERRIIVKGVDANFTKNIIEAPARALEYGIEDVEIVSREVEEYLSANPAKLPMVQYAFSEWWEQRDRARRLLPVEVWRRLGGVDGALSFAAEHFFLTLDEAQQARVESLFLRLFRGGRKQSLLEELLSAEDRALMGELVRLRLVGRREKKASAPFYEVEHESLSAHWGRLERWLAKARDAQMLLDELERDAAAYLSDGDPDRLWKRGRIAVVKDMTRCDGVVVSDGALQFLKHAGRRARRGRFVGAGTALLLSLAWLLALAAATSRLREQEYLAKRQERSAIERRDAAVEAMTRAERDANTAANAVNRARQEEALAKALADKAREAAVKADDDAMKANLDTTKATKEAIAAKDEAARAQQETAKAKEDQRKADRAARNARDFANHLCQWVKESPEKKCGGI